MIAKVKLAKNNSLRICISLRINDDVVKTKMVPAESSGCIKKPFLVGGASSDEQ